MRIKTVDYISNAYYEENCFYLEDRHWNDYGYYTTYYLYYFKEGNLYNFGEVKILEKDKKETRLKVEFDKLGDTYCSLGQSKDYYENIKKYLKEDIASKLLISLNDCCYKKEIYLNFKNDDGFINSLLRYTIATRLVKDLGKEILAGIIENKKNNFYKYTHKMENAALPHELEFNFKKSKLPHRINAIIGKNGVGKTEILKNLMIDLILKKYEAFSEYPEYEKIFFFSYGIYDSLENLMNLKEESLNKFELLGINFNEEKIITLLEEIRLQDKEEYLRSILLDFMTNIEVVNAFFRNPKENLKRYSSGQKMIVEFTIEMISKIEKESLIVIDEPENHLHPNLMSRLMKYVIKILEDYSSHAIMSTHSPLILQQITSEHVILLKRWGNRPIVSKLDIECFGEDLSEITNSIFNVNEVEDNYKDILFKLTESGLSHEEILSLFKNKLSYNVKLYLKQCFYKKYGER